MRLARFDLAEDDRKRLEARIQESGVPELELTTVKVLLGLASGDTARYLGSALGLTPSTITRIRNGYLGGGLARALADRTRSKHLPHGQELRAKVMEMLRTPPPKGRKRWTVRLLAEEVSKGMEGGAKVSSETIRRIIHSAWGPPAKG